LNGGVSTFQNLDRGKKKFNFTITLALILLVTVTDRPTSDWEMEDDYENLPRGYRSGLDAYRCKHK